jgi:peptidoglycan hydrolase-like protein with peptidoglycan-binding domain
MIYVKQGMRGNPVKSWQEILNRVANKIGLTRKLVTDGIFGAGTKNATIKMQIHLGVSPDGVVGTQTYTALRKKYPYISTGYLTQGKYAPPVAYDRVATVPTYSQTKDPTFKMPDLAPPTPKYTQTRRTPVFRKDSTVQTVLKENTPAPVEKKAGVGLPLAIGAGLIAYMKFS